MSLFSKHLKQLRLLNNLAQKDFAVALGIVPTSYQKYEYGTREPSYDMLNNIAAYFDVSVDFLIGAGIFSKWDIILEHKNDIVQAILSAVPEGEFLTNLKALFENDDKHIALIKLVPVFVEDVSYDSDTDNLTIKLTI